MSVPASVEFFDEMRKAGEGRWRRREMYSRLKSEWDDVEYIVLWGLEERKEVGVYKWKETRRTKPDSVFRQPLMRTVTVRPLNDILLDLYHLVFVILKMKIGSLPTLSAGCSRTEITSRSWV